MRLGKRCCCLGSGLGSATEAEVCVFESDLVVHSGGLVVMVVGRLL